MFYSVLTKHTFSFFVKKRLPNKRCTSKSEKKKMNPQKVPNWAKFKHSNARNTNGDQHVNKKPSNKYLHSAKNGPSRRDWWGWKKSISQDTHIERKREAWTQGEKQRSNRIGNVKNFGALSYYHRGLQGAAQRGRNIASCLLFSGPREHLGAPLDTKHPRARAIWAPNFGSISVKNLTMNRT